MTSEFIENEGKKSLFNFETIFNFLYNLDKFNMTLKAHMIIHHYKFYFEKKGKNFKNKNREFGETLNSTFKKN